MKIYKYPLQYQAEQAITVKADFRPLCVQLQNGLITVWAVVDEDSPEDERIFHIVGTGHDIPKSFGLAYIGTVQELTSKATTRMFVWHIFMEVK